MNTATYEVERVSGQWQVRCKACGYTEMGDTPQQGQCPSCTTKWELGEPHTVDADGVLTGETGF